MKVVELLRRLRDVVVGDAEYLIDPVEYVPGPVPPCLWTEEEAAALVEATRDSLLRERDQ